MSADIVAMIDAVEAEVNALPDKDLGGPAAEAARNNVRRVARYLRALHANRGALPRHDGKASTGKVAAVISEDSHGRFNRQNFFTNDWCSKLLADYDAWELGKGLSRLDAAAAVAEAKQPRDERIAALEEKLLVAEAEKQQMRQEIAFLRGFVAETGRVP